MRSKKLSYFVFSLSAMFGKLMIIDVSIALGKTANDNKL